MSQLQLSLSDRTNYLICGYLRQHRGTVPFPIDIANICIVFYGIVTDFESSILDSREDKDALIDLLSTKIDLQSIVSIESLYHNKTHKCSADEFYSKCNGMSPTITLIKNEKGFLFGGYTEIAWSLETGFKTDKNAFLFFLKCNDNDKKAQIYDVISAEHAVYHFDSGQYGKESHLMHYGPWFGEEDIVIWATRLSCTCRPKSYDIKGNSKNLCGYGEHEYFSNFDYEVFHLKPLQH